MGRLKVNATKGGLKVTLLLDQRDGMSSYITITDAKAHDSAISKTLNHKLGSIIAVARGYPGFKQINKWNRSKIFFVTRMKDNIFYKTKVHGCRALVRNTCSYNEIILTKINTKTQYS